MKRTILASTLAAAMALTPLSPAPARAADANDVAAVLAGLGVLYVIGRAIDDDRRSPATSAENSRFGQPVTHYEQPSAHRHGRARLLPAECLRQVRTNRGLRNAYPAHCLARNMRRVGRLPERCQWEVDTPRGGRTFYSARCLERAGWRTDPRSGWARRD